MSIRKLRALFGPEGTEIRRLAAKAFTKEPDVATAAWAGNAGEVMATNQGSMLFRSAEQGSAPFSLGGLGATHASGGRVILSHARTDETPTVPSKAEAVGHRMMLVGGLSVTGGLALMATVIFAGAGVLGIVFGGVTLLSGWLTVSAAKRWTRVSTSLAR